LLVGVAVPGCGIGTGVFAGGFVHDGIFEKGCEGGVEDACYTGLPDGGAVCLILVLVF